MKLSHLAVSAAALALQVACADAKPYTRNVAIVVYPNAQPLDWTGPYEVYNDASRSADSGGQPALNVYIVSKTKEPIDCQGLKVTPTYSIQDAPKPDIVVFPGGPSNKITDDAEFFAWAKKASLEAEIAQSVCTGAFVLAKAGMLDGLEVTTFHGSIDQLQRNYPKTSVKRGRRFVDNGNVVTTAGISAGIDGSLHVVARLLGRRVADQVAMYMEYAWSPEPSLAMGYTYFNPSADEYGRMGQTGEMQLEEKRHVDAAKTFKAIVEHEPNDAEAWYRLGEALSMGKKHEEAAGAFVRSAQAPKNPMASWSYYGAAAEFAQAGNKDQAISMLGKALDGGYPRARFEADERFASLRNEPRVKQLLAAGK